MDFTNNINSVLAKKPDLFLSGIAGPPWPSFVQQAQRFDFFTKTKTLGTYLLGSELTTPFGKSYPEGIQSSTWAPFYDTSIAGMKAFSDAYFAKTKLYPADLTMIRYVSALAITNAIKQAGSTDPDKIVAAMETINLDIPTGKIHYNSYHQANLPIYMVTSGYSNDFPIAIGLNPVRYQDDVYPTADQVKALNP
jgi:branched-chain amino acid transport system substrate-binding protein